MSCLSWNCRRAANPRAIHVLKDLVRGRRADFIFLIETICDSGKFSEIKHAINYDDCAVVDKRGHSGGLALFWNNTIGVTLIGQLDHHIDMKVKFGHENPYRLTGFYSHADRGQRHLSWALIRELAQLNNLPWLLLGTSMSCVAQMRRKEGIDILCI